MMVLMKPHVLFVKSLSFHLASTFLRLSLARAIAPLGAGVSVILLSSTKSWIVLKKRTAVTRTPASFSL